MSGAVYVILLEGNSVSECYLGFTSTFDSATVYADNFEGASVYQTDRDAIRRIERAVENERQMMESIRTGLGRAARGVRA